MPTTSRSPGSVNSAPSSLQSDTLSAPTVSHRGYKEVPYRAPDDDHVSLSMKHRNHRHEPHDTSSPPMAAIETEGRRRRNQPTGCRPRARSLRKTNSSPTVQPRFEQGTVETFGDAPQSKPSRARRWTISSKAASTRGLATLVPANDTSQRATADSRSTTYENHSPAMITLRRATTARPQRQTTTLTSFPPPKFSRDSNGLLTSFLNTITSYSDAPLSALGDPGMTKQVAPNSRRPSTSSTKDDARPSTSALAPPVHTEVVALEPRLSVSGSNQAASSMRRCSTRYISENVVYEIIWDENLSSSASSEDGNPSPGGRGSSLQSRELGGTDTLERRLSNALSRPGRASTDESRSRRTSYVPGVELSLHSIWTNPKIARLFREPASERLPRSKSSTKTSDVFPSLSTEAGSSQVHTTSFPDRVEFFPSYRSRASTNGNGPGGDLTFGPAPDDLQGDIQADQNAFSEAQEDVQLGAAGSRFGSMIGVSSHAKRRRTSDHHEQRHRSVNIGGRRASEGRRLAKASDDETLPLLGGTVDEDG
ncbi:hypothetical protein G647_06929 [Cladophialophora carrionii CBS 160.54]|uniref:Uncharacterized protein n=1 Tax=Cladophialophora carrionii CBS 160.54 TaxID=1279043 RepID=V9DA77_9EURO|nr:uncharacterized protein G647_06929 [Cladophialophora carrionii CBS 160.54]ETI22852.1 hypothetical protein G647_06929 [Cladophialophora carrionii CBS 160.54]